MYLCHGTSRFLHCVHEEIVYLVAQFSHVSWWHSLSVSLLEVLIHDLREGIKFPFERNERSSKRNLLTASALVSAKGLHSP